MPKNHLKAKIAHREAASAGADMRPSQRSPAAAPLKRSRAVLRPAQAKPTPAPVPVVAQDHASAGPDAPEFDEATLMRLVQDMRVAKGTHKRKLSVREKAAVASTVLIELRYAFVIGLAVYLYTNPEMYFAIVAYITDIAGQPVTTVAQN